MERVIKWGSYGHGIFLPRQQDSLNALCEGGCCQEEYRCNATGQLARPFRPAAFSSLEIPFPAPVPFRLLYYT